MDEQKEQDKSEPKRKFDESNHPRRRRGDQEGLRGRFASAKEYKAQGMAAFLVLAAVIVFYYALKSLPVVATILGKIVTALTSVIVGFCIAFLLNPVVGFFERQFIKLGNRKRRKSEPGDDAFLKDASLVGRKQIKAGGKARNFAILVTYLIALSLITLLFAAVLPEFYASIGTLVDNLEPYSTYLQNFVERLISKNKSVEAFLQPVVKSVTEGIKDILSDRSNEILAISGKWAAASVIFVLKMVFTVFIGFIFSIYLLKEKEYLIGMMKKIIFAIFPKKTAKITIQTAHKANNIFSTAILGKILDSFIIGLLCFIGTSILGIFFSGIEEYKGLVSIIVGVTNVIPFFGPFIGGIPCSILIFCVKPLHGVIFAAFVLVLQQFDGNYLDPHIVGKKVGLRPIFVLFACMLFSNLWGVLGMLLAVPTFALVYSILKSYFEVRLENKNLPKDTSSYMDTPGAVLARSGEPGGVKLELLYGDDDDIISLVEEPIVVNHEQEPKPVDEKKE